MGAETPRAARGPYRSRHTSTQFMAAGGTRLHLQAWVPAADDVASPAPPQAVLAVVHGYGDHGGRYTWLGEAMAARGLAVYVYDLRGHGQSSGVRGQVDSFASYLDDTVVFLDEVRRLQPAAPRFLLGHSLGGLIVSRLAEERAPDVRGLILSSPFFALAEAASPAKLLAARLLAAVWPGKDVGNTVRAADLSHEQSVVEAYVTDRLVHHVAPARWAVQTLAAQDAAMAEAERVSLPLLLLYGTEDQVADESFADAFFARASSADKTVLRYEGYFHECFNETGRERVFADLAAWLLDRVEQPAPFG